MVTYLLWVHVLRIRFPVGPFLTRDSSVGRAVDCSSNGRVFESPSRDYLISIQQKSFFMLKKTKMEIVLRGCEQKKTKFKRRGSAEVARQAHNLEVNGSIPFLAHL